MNRNKGWIGVDLDGTLATYTGWQGPAHIGAPVPLMVARVKQWLKEGKSIRIFTARVCGYQDLEIRAVKTMIEAWCVIHIGIALPITNIKDRDMIELWDDRAIQVIPNTGISVRDFK